MRIPGRMVVGSLVNSTPLALSSAATASMPVTAARNDRGPDTAWAVAAVMRSGSTGVIDTLAPPTLRSMRGLPCCMVRITSAPNVLSYYAAVASGFGLRRWMWSQPNLAIVSLPVEARQARAARGSIPIPLENVQFAGRNQQDCPVRRVRPSRGFRQGAHG